MIDRSRKDALFRDQINNANTETKEFVNLIVKTFEIMEMKNKKITFKKLFKKIKQRKSTVALANYKMQKLEKRKNEK